MGDSKSIGQLLKELDAMQKQFDHLNDELIVENRKKKRVKTELSSNEIDDEFFKTFSAPLVKKNTTKKEQEKTVDKDLVEDELLFELEIEQKTEENDSVIENKISNKKLFEEKKNIGFSENKESKKVFNEKIFSTQVEDVKIENKKPKKLEEAVVEPDKELKDYSYLTIKERLERIQYEISLKEEALKKVKLKNKQQNITKVVKLNQNGLTNKTLSAKKEDKLAASSVSVLKPKKQVSSTINKAKTKLKNDIKRPTVNERKKDGQKVNKKKKLDGLTITILILLVVLFVTAWVLLF